MHLEIHQLLAAAAGGTLRFSAVIDTLRRHYECTPVAFSTGVGSDRRTDNAAGTNAASSQLLAFARRLGLDEPTTLALYAEHYRDVLADPDGSGHANIRAFMANGWSGVRFQGDPLRLKGPG